jgi:hypothetical protein
MNKAVIDSNVLIATIDSRDVFSGQASRAGLKANDGETSGACGLRHKIHNENRLDFLP